MKGPKLFAFTPNLTHRTKGILVREKKKRVSVDVEKRQRKADYEREE